MTDDDAVVIAALEDYRELLARMMTLIERLTDRVEVLERQHLPLDTRQLGGD